MFENFLKTFPQDQLGDSAGTNKALASNEKALSQVLKSLGGGSFGGGIYRVIQVADLNVWAQRVSLAFPMFEERITCFGYDWLGRVFAEDPARLVGGLPGVVMFEPGTGESLEIPSNILTFHDEELLQFGDAALATSFYQQWLEQGGKRPTARECVGYKQPLFLGGKDDVENLELCDVDVYWHISCQLILQARGLPVDTQVNITAAKQLTN